MARSSSKAGYSGKRAIKTSGIDWILLCSYLGLVVTGLLMIYTTTYNDYTDQMWSLSSPFGGQLLWAGISVIIIIILTFLDWHIWNSLSIPIYLVSVASLLLVLIFGNEVKGATSWFNLGFVSFQPGEFAKLGTAMASASLLSSVHTKLSEYRPQLIVFGVMILPAFLIILQPDPGSALTFASLMVAYYRFGMPTKYYLGFLSIFLTIVFSLTHGFYISISGVLLVWVAFTSQFSKKNITIALIFLVILLLNILCYQFDVMPYAVLTTAIYFLVHLFYFNASNSLPVRLSAMAGVAILCLISFSSSFAFENILKPHQQDRINVWLQPEKCNPRGSLYNLIQSKVAIGSGGLSGKGYLNGTLTKFNYVPEQTTDFIFSSIGEEQGFLGSASVVILFLIMTLRLINIGENSSYNFIRGFCYAIAGFVFIHFFINIGMTMGVSPVIGIPLPFISRGGTALLVFSMMIGISLNMSRESR